MKSSFKSDFDISLSIKLILFGGGVLSSLFNPLGFFPLVSFILMHRIVVDGTSADVASKFLRIAEI